MPSFDGFAPPLQGFLRPKAAERSDGMEWKGMECIFIRTSAGERGGVSHPRLINSRGVKAGGNADRLPVTMQ